MKSIFNLSASLYLLCLITLTFFSCTKKDNPSLTSTVNHELTHLIKSARAGNIKYEEIHPQEEDTSSTKTETGCDDTTVMSTIQQQIEENLAGIVRSTSGSSVGVFKDQTCDQWDEIDIYMDCENHKPNSHAYNSGASGITGSSSDNIIMKFCIVPSDHFEAGPYPYGVLAYEPVLPNGWGLKYKVGIYQDNQDDNLTNYNINSIHKYPGSVDLYDTWWGGTSLPNKVHNNSYLTFYTFIGNTGGSFPYLGFSYFVLGTAPSNLSYLNGYLDCDDEDNKNANGISIVDCSDNSLVSDTDTGNANSISGLIEPHTNGSGKWNGNTKYCLTKVN